MIMKNEAEAATSEMSELASNAQGLLDETGHLAEKKISEARKKLSATLERTWSQVQDKTIQGAKVTDEAIRDHPYQAIGVAFGVGALIGFLLTRRS
jgi:ElaB/YqjD/DUF883 family membrane-anchored ribosome-binding protein